MLGDRRGVKGGLGGPPKVVVGWREKGFASGKFVIGVGFKEMDILGIIIRD